MTPKQGSNTASLRQVLVRSAAVLAVVGGLSGCSMFASKEAPPPCPTIKIDRDTARLTQFRGEGQDITDTVMETEIIGYTGECSVDKKTNVVDMTLSIAFLANLGPAAVAANKDGERRQSFSYFVALPDFFPHPSGKQVFSAELVFPPNVNQLRYRDAEVRLRIPLAKSISSGDARVYLGMQLTDPQLQFNRKNRPTF
jgi:hypothetical protein